MSSIFETSSQLAGSTNPRLSLWKNLRNAYSTECLIASSHLMQITSGSDSSGYFLKACLVPDHARIRRRSRKTFVQAPLQIGHFLPATTSLSRYSIQAHHGTTTPYLLAKSSAPHPPLSTEVRYRGRSSRGETSYNSFPKSIILSMTSL